MILIEPQTLYFTGGRSIQVIETIELKKGITTVIGPNGSGKSTFMQILQKGKNFRTNKIEMTTAKYPTFQYIEFNNIHSLPGVSIGYYQQRYEQGMNEEVPDIISIFGEQCSSTLFLEWCDKFNLQGIEKKKINHLSSGELRKLLIINSLYRSPDILVLDNPYIGLDSGSRQALNDAFKKLKDAGKNIVLVLQDKKDVPEFSDHCIYVRDLKVFSINPPQIPFEYSRFPFQTKPKRKIQNIVCQLKDCTVSYNSETILENLSWEIKEGERWALLGKNGSGKSTLLSLINADNPKGYCNNIWLFGKRRGSGETIWDIKKKIGYVSPEMSLHFHGSGNILELVANGLNDTVGLYVKPNDTQKQRALKWLEYFNLDHLQEKAFNTLSSGEKQLVLIARSFIKEPELLILDEPMHGLDEKNKKIVKRTINDFLDSHPDSAFIMVTHYPEELPDYIDHRLELT